MDLRVHKDYKLVQKIGSGAFGELYQATHVKTGEQFAVKLEPLNTKFPQLLYESKLYKVLQGGTGIPRTIWFGVEGHYNALVMELLGHSLEDLFNYCKRRFSLKTVLMLGEQMVARIEYMHQNNFIHRDMKPDNFLMGQGNKKSMVYIIDFGLSKRYRDPKTSQHIPYRDGKDLTGTARYASVNTHLGVEQSRRDDLEAIGYILIYFLKGSLPWQGLVQKNAAKNKKYDAIRDKKVQTSVQSLCRDLPDEFFKYLQYVRSLKFEEQPNYTYCKGLFRELMERQGFEFDGRYDWVLKKEGVKVPIGRDYNSAPREIPRETKMTKRMP